MNPVARSTSFPAQTIDCASPLAHRQPLALSTANDHGCRAISTVFSQQSLPLVVSDVGMLRAEGAQDGEKRHGE